MDDRATERYEPQEPLPTYDWDFDTDQQGGPRILWGRVIALGVALLFAFLFGRATAGGGGDASADELAAARDQIATLQTEVDSLRNQLEQSVQPTTSPPPDEDNDDGAQVEGETYVVEKGDTLRSIAESQYGDASLDDCIAVANDIDDPEFLVIGAELTLPPEEECE